MNRTTCMVLMLAMLAACSAEVKGPSVKVRPATIEVDPDGGGQGNFCPPGQAKKGRC